MLEALVAVLITGLLMAGVVTSLQSLVRTAATPETDNLSGSDWRRINAELTADLNDAAPCDRQQLEPVVRSIGAQSLSFTVATSTGAQLIRWQTSGNTLERATFTPVTECDFPTAPDSTVTLTNLLSATSTAAGTFAYWSSGEQIAVPSTIDCLTFEGGCSADHVTLNLSFIGNAHHDTHLPLPALRATETFAIDVPGIPNAPTVVDAPGDGTVHVSWLAPLNAAGTAIDTGSEPLDGWTIEYSTDPTFTTSTTLLVNDPNQLSTTLTGLTDGTPIYVRVAAISAAGPSGMSTATGGTPVGTPGMPSSLTATFNPVDLAEVNVTVSAPVDLAGGTLVAFEAQTQIDGSWVPSPPTTLTGPAGTLTLPAAASTDVAVRVRAINEEGPSAWRTADAEMFNTPDAPTGLTLALSGSTLDFGFLPPIDDGGSPIIRYELQYDIDDAGWSTWASIGLNTSGAITLPTAPTVDIDVAVRAVTRVGSGPATEQNTGPIVAPSAVEFLLVGGGGGGGNDSVHGGAGGGAGGYISSVDGESSGGNSSPVADLIPVAGTSYDVVVGAGGASPSDAPYGTNGSPSQLASFVALGGGGGGRNGGSPEIGLNGSSGGGGGGGLHTGPWGLNNGGSGTSGQGHEGGQAGYCFTGGGAGGGGGGAMGAGGNGGCSSATGGAGGAGATSSISGAVETYAAGGAGGYWLDIGAVGPPNTGNGGGHREAGGSGVVIIRFDGTKALPTISAGLTYTVSSVDGDHVIKFTAGSGTITW